MQDFIYSECDSNNIIEIKKLVKKFANKEKYIKNYQNIITDTKTARENIATCLNSDEELKKRLSLIQKENIGFLDDVLGLKERGNNNSRYRAYLSMEGNYIVEIRISNHYTTKDTTLTQSNNKSQYLFQVVLITNSPKTVLDNAIKHDTNAGNTKLLTDTIISSFATLDDVKRILQEFSDYLLSPNTFVNNRIQTTNLLTNKTDLTNNKKQINCNKNIKTDKKTIRLTESDLHRVIKESVNKVLKEDFDMDEFSKQKQDYDVMTNTYECNLSFLEIQSIKSYMTRIKTLVNKIRKGENSEIVYKYLYNCIDNINNIMENK